MILQIVTAPGSRRLCCPIKRCSAEVPRMQPFARHFSTRQIVSIAMAALSEFSYGRRAGGVAQ